MTKEGKLDVTFVRMNVLKKQLDNTHAPESLVYRYLKEKGFDNPKKVYATFTGFKSKRGNSDGGEGGVPYMVVYTPAVKTYGQPDMDLVILHEMFHAQGAAYACGKRTYKGKHVKVLMFLQKIPSNHQSIVKMILIIDMILKDALI